MKNFEMPNVKVVSFTQFENIAGKCGAFDDLTAGEDSNPSFD